MLTDHQALQYVNGVIKVPDDHRFKGEDGFERHGDTAIAGVLMWHASTLAPVEYDYIPVSDLDGGSDSIFSESTGGRALW
ncbi:Uncharacterised protein [Starkeya nomas]|uniref:Uncharacterized protein n=1 Tax=Starkeya nomas TaxID=2666134 RepID=A0A5S9R5U0_9HYPH|nr:Uncharacterised protein [Starkeya nomas]